MINWEIFRAGRFLGRLLYSEFRIKNEKEMHNYCEVPLLMVPATPLQAAADVIHLLL